MDLANLLGMPLELLLGAMPKKASKAVNSATNAALRNALKVAAYRLNGSDQHNSTGRGYKFAVAVTGAIGGFFGLSAIAIEVPVSTALILRSVAAIASSEVRT